MAQKRYTISISLLLLALVTLVALTMSATSLSAQSSDSGWEAWYWNNRTLSGDPVLHRFEPEINYDWGSGSPAPEVNVDNFSARWTRTIYVGAGTYRFTATMDDGMRVWLNDVLIIDSWYDSQVHSISADAWLPEGSHRLRVEYYETGGQAVAKFNWTAPPGIINNWRGEYYNNVTLSGAPALVRDDPQINFDWGVGSPAWNVVRADQFSVRWTRNLNLPAGRYRFTTTTDDGVRLWVNNALLIDRWIDQAATTYSAEVDLPGGSIPVKMEYYENQGGASARLAWIQVSGAVVNNWRGEYFNNKNLSGAPALVRDDGQINFNWGSGSPAPGIIGVDNFSVRWTRNLNLNAGRYRFTVRADDGARLWVNNALLVDQWRDQEAATYSAEIDLPGGSIPVKLEYYESTGLAEVNLAWTQVTVPPPAPPPAPGPGTATITAYRLNVRHGPGVQYGIITTVSRGQQVTLAGYRNAAASWVKVILANGTTQGWVNASYLATTYPIASLAVAEVTPPDTGGPATATVTAYYLNVRTGPGVGYGVIALTSRGQVVQLAGYRNANATWVKVILPNGTQGWVNASYLSTSYPLMNLQVGGW